MESKNNTNSEDGVKVYSAVDLVTQIVHMAPQSHEVYRPQLRNTIAEREFLSEEVAGQIIAEAVADGILEESGNESVRLTIDFESSQ